jgi:hypothetical protein
MKTILHVNQHVTRSNRVNGENEPVITVKTHKDNRYAHEVDILDKDGNVVATIIVHRPQKPLSCGARVWIETNNEAVLR